MKKIVIIGNSAAGISAAEAIRDRDKEAKLVIVSQEPFLAYERHRILDLLEGKVKEKDLCFRSQDFYKNNAIELLTSKEVVELNTTKKKVIFKERDFIEFDELIIATGAAVSLPELRGIQKQGVVALDGLKDVKFILENLPIAHTVIVVGSQTIALEVARIIAAKKIDVKLFAEISHVMDAVEVISGNPIVEILGDSEMKAVRLANQKVIGASIAIFSGPKQPRIDFLQDTDIKTNKGILVDDAMRTSVPFVFAVGDVSEPSSNQKAFGWENAQSEGKSIAGILCQA